MSQDLPTTSYALLGLLTLGDDLTGYELKQRADNTLRFYWVSPAMSQVYTELSRLDERGLVASRDRSADNSARRTRRYRITAQGRRALRRWLHESPVGFPSLKHPVALRLLMAHLIEPDEAVAMLRDHVAALDERRSELQAVRDSLRDADAEGEPFRYPALVADWGLGYYASERAIMIELVARLEHGT